MPGGEKIRPEWEGRYPKGFKPEGKVRSVYIKNDRDFWKNEQDRFRLKGRLRGAKNNATYAALKRRDEAAILWRGRRMEVPKP